jgi:2-iminobutanoate/2-iminopropanoate deaminase
MKSILAAAAAVMLLPACAFAAEPIKVTHFPAGGMPAGMAPAPGVMAPAFSGAVMAGNTLYVSGTTDTDRATGKPPPDPKDGARLVLNSIKATVEGAGLTMDDLAWVQIFCSDLSYYAAFNEVYRTYFKGPLPARAFLGVDHLLGGAHFEVMGIAVKSAK